MSINEAPSPNLIGRQVDRSTSGQADNSVLAVQINDMGVGVGGGLALPPGIVYDHA